MVPTSCWQKQGKFLALSVCFADTFLAANLDLSSSGYAFFALCIFIRLSLLIVCVVRVTVTLEQEK